MYARLLKKKSIHTVKCIGSRVTDSVIVVLTFVPIVLTIYLHVLKDAVADRDLT